MIWYVSRALSPPAPQVFHIKKTFPIITTYNPKKAEITMKTFFIQMVFPCFLRPLIQASKICVFNYYVAKKLSLQNTHITAQHFSLSDSPPSRVSQRHKHWRRSFPNGKTSLRFELIFEDFPLGFFYRWLEAVSFTINFFSIHTPWRWISFTSNDLDYYFNKDFFNKSSLWIDSLHHELEKDCDESCLNMRKLKLRIK